MTITYSRGRSVTDAQPQQRQAADFAALVAALDADRAASKPTAAYICGPLNGSGHRCAEGALPRRFIALDFDRVAPDALAGLGMRLAGFSGCGWPTHSSKPDAPRWRAILELDREATRDECMRLGDVLAADFADEFGEDILLDVSTHRGEQPVFVPPAGVTLARYTGDPINVDRYLRDAPAARDDRPHDKPAKPGTESMLQQLAAGEALHETIGRMVAQWAQRGMERAAIEAAARGLVEMARPARGGRVDDFSGAELQRLIDGAMRKFGRLNAPELGAWSLPDPIGADEMTAARLTPRCIVADYLYADVGALIAPGGTSKTTAQLFEAVHIVLARRIWGLSVETPGGVVIVTAEDRREFLVARLREICAALKLTPVERAQVQRLIRIDDCTTSVRRLATIVADVVTASTFAEDLVAGCKAAGFAPALVVFDPLVSFGVGEARVNDAEQALIQAGRIIVAGLDCCVRFVHHTGKQVARDKTVDMYAGRGGSALADGCRMVHVMQTVDEAELLKATGERLSGQQSAFILARPKVSYAPPQRAPIYVLRDGYAFTEVQARTSCSDDERRAAIGEQLALFIEAEFRAGRQHTRNTLETLHPENLSRPDVRAGLAWLQSSGRLLEVDVIGPDGKRPAKGARTHLRAATGGEATANRRG